MTFDAQTWAALAIVALAAAFLLKRAFGRRKSYGCCPPDKFKSSLKR